MPSVPASLAPARSSLLAALSGALRSAGDDRSVHEVAGLCGLAFAHRVAPGLGPEGGTGFAWATELGPALHVLGYAPRLHYAPAGDPLLEVVRASAIDDIEREITAGRAAIAWGIQLPAFGLVRGIDRAEETLVVAGVLDGCDGEIEMPFGRLGRGEAPALFVLALGERRLVDSGATLDAALDRAAREISGAASVEGSSVAGLAAYDVSIAAVQRGDFDPRGAALGVAILAEARRLASEWLRSVAGAPPIAQAADAAWQASGALAAAAETLPFPVPSGLEITASRRADLVASLEAARRADAALLRHLRDGIAARRAGAVASLTIEPLDTAGAGDLFRCLADVPLAVARSSETRCRDALAPRLGRDFHALVARGPGGVVVGHVYYAPLDRSYYPIRADRPALLLFCAWIGRELRGRGLGRRLVEALRAHARTLGVAGILAESTELDVFLPEGSWRGLGFREVDREGPMRLGYLPVDDAAPVIEASWIHPDPDAVGITVRHAPNCPLLDGVRRAAARAARAAGVAVDEAKAAGPEAGVSGRGRRLPNFPVPADAVHLLVVR